MSRLQDYNEAMKTVGVSKLARLDPRLWVRVYFSKKRLEKYLDTGENKEAIEDEVAGFGGLHLLNRIKIAKAKREAERGKDE